MTYGSGYRKDGLWGNQLWQWLEEEWSMGVTSYGSGEGKNGLWG